MSLTLDDKDTPHDTSWVLKKGGSDDVIVGCSLDSDQCQSPIAFTGGSTVQTTLTVNASECYTVTMYSCSGEGLYGTGSWAVALDGTPTFGSNSSFSDDSISVGTCN